MKTLLITATLISLMSFVAHADDKIKMTTQEQQDCNTAQHKLLKLKALSDEQMILFPNLSTSATKVIRAAQSLEARIMREVEATQARIQSYKCNSNITLQLQNRLEEIIDQ